MLSLIEEASGFCLLVFDISREKLRRLKTMFFEKSIYLFAIVIFFLDFPEWETDDDISFETEFF